MNASLKWVIQSRIGLEPSTGGVNDAIATSWVHIDVREFGSANLKDEFFCKTEFGCIGNKMSQLIIGEAI